MPYGKKSGYLQNVDRLIEETSLAAVLSHFGQELPAKPAGEHRMNCVFNAGCSESSYGQLTVRIDDVANRIYCHCCGVRGNLLTLIHGLQEHRAPDGGRLKGEEFKTAVGLLREIAGEEPSSSNTASPHSSSSQSSSPPERKGSITPEQLSAERSHANTPLVRHEKEAARQLADLHTELVTDLSCMRPEAAAYLRARPWLTPELLQKWGVGWIPGNGRSLFRKNYLVYTHRNERGDVVSYSGRDLLFERKQQESQEKRTSGKTLKGKHRYVQGFRKGVELYGGQVGRLQELWVLESLEQYGVMVVEGMNEVLRCETVGLAAVGLTSNRATDAQIQKLVRFARIAGQNRIVLLPDCDEAGETGFRELLWRLADQQVDVRLGCSSTCHNGHFAGRQPEAFSDEEFDFIKQSLVS